MCKFFIRQSILFVSQHTLFFSAYESRYKIINLQSAAQSSNGSVSRESTQRFYQTPQKSRRHETSPLSKSFTKRVR